ncbi:MAG TPA: AAA family ATPase [Thermoanaerobaculaceae bacterium]|nr:AAA family ATPase [Thermoanaerobaculaceae bacterium]HRS17319.1 AAA family ATPase [Thermoanaerobaculaceae bacterium]
MSWLVPFAALTAEQRRAVQLTPERHRLIAGPPGSGKTMVLLHRAAFLRDTHGIPPERLHVFVYTKTLRAYIRSELELLGLPATCVSTFDSWCLGFFRTHLRLQLPMAGRQPDYPAVRAQCATWVREHPFRNPPFDAAMVDEGQDLDESTFAVLRAVARHLSVCTDPGQQLYETGSSEERIRQWLGLGNRNVSLLDAFRCVPLVSRLASLYIDDPGQREAFLRQVRASQGEREMPVFFVAADPAEERRRLVEVLRARIARGERTAILVPSTHMQGALLAELWRAGVAIETRHRLSFDDLVPKLLTYHSGKGLVFDSVLMPGVADGAFRHGDASSWLRLLFVGITRARRWVYLSTTWRAKGIFGPLQRLLAPEAAGCCEVQWGSGVPAPRLEPPAAMRPAAVELPPVAEDDPTALL